MANKVQDPITLILSVVYVAIVYLLLGASFIQSVSLKINLLTLTGIMLTSAQVSNPALKYWVFL